LKILAIDLSASEDIRLNPKKYGGVGRTLRILSDNIDDFFIVGNKDLIDKSYKFIGLERKELDNIRGGEELSNYIKEDYDLIFHTCPNINLNTEINQLVWVVGQGENVHVYNKNILLHNKRNQKPILFSEDHKIHEFVLGIDIPPFKQHIKEDFLVQVSNHFPHINSISLASLCIKYGIKCYFGGPISEGYPLLEYIDNKNTFYLGEIPEQEKIDLVSRASFYVSLYSFPINEPPLSIKQSLSLGTPILSNMIGGIKDLLQDGINGFNVFNEDSFLNAWNNRKNINYLDCYNSSLNYSKDKMIDSFKRVLEDLL
jgi:glycosyltransferase involved in cell wall biosynthesis